MSNWLILDPRDALPCCAVTICTRSPQKLTQEGDTLKCTECGQIWVWHGDRLEVEDSI
ncbi:MAG: hypothetical protein WC455_29960 [Dehalococcoidia bacterium]|jgi:hypothetical protein